MDYDNSSLMVTNSNACMWFYKDWENGSDPHHAHDEHMLLSPTYHNAHAAWPIPQPTHAAVLTHQSAHDAPLAPIMHTSIHIAHHHRHESPTLEGLLSETCCHLEPTAVIKTLCYVKKGDVKEMQKADPIKPKLAVLN